MPERSVRAWKAFRVGRQGRLRFMFHPHAGSTVVPLSVWLESQAKWVTNPGKKAGQKHYRAGFHYFRDWESIIAFQKLTKWKYVIRPVLVSGVHPKPRTNVGSWLARHLYVVSKRRVSPARLEKAIADMQLAHDIHERIAERFEQDPGLKQVLRPLAKASGGIRWQKRWIKSYDRVLEILVTCPPGSTGSAELKKVIADMQKSRYTHVAWRDYLRKNPKRAGETAPLAKIVDDETFHRNCVLKYDRVIDVLRAIQTQR